MQAFPWERPVTGCRWHWRHNMRHHCEMRHPSFPVNEERAAGGGLIAFEEGEAAFGGETKVVMDG